ncbi:bifunctional adenosylcobinamide kinase/adenosylcobinamide-phosphate guanylyltransferase [Xinfangfangia sp. D13-10-4-6]|uniref:bifunctional adenosylcobinamide kinase/adenosylcobinamide-phosphate guanylyltransferase n=1 Tax=Pseudogemmobacter hezensis TaxID=2737662 RepID=UPI001551F5E9|nr:bifunctional adenosylcobinamide kinase/adenosylcobinamide-phosphate guanylyltransferase [Pseudogemmobacter hezensis]NPD14181.1 bifunctional adenosylcobinamide kinase/adenosylcobinamide-phosphate guanylyltransferase [Pseudogemmobacter hezensis]
MFPPLTLITGGARSGKSAWAEALARHSGLRRRYIATAQAFDAEMAERIRQHQTDRGPDWETFETPFDAAPALAAAPADSVTLFDCATLWLTNHLLAENDLAQETKVLLIALAAAQGPVIMVTNEVGQGIVPADALSRRFRDAQGRLNQQLAAQADLVVAVMCGLPLALKGSLPQGVTR